MWIKWWFLSVVLALSVQVSGKPLSFVSSDYQPYHAPGLKDGGPLAILVQKAFAAQQIDTDIRYLSWGEVMRQGVEPEVAGIIGAWDIPERHQQFYFSSPLYYNELRFFALKTITKRHLNQLASALPRLGIVKDYAYPRAVHQAGFTIIMADTDQALMQLLLNKQVDVILADTGTARFWHQQTAPDTILHGSQLVLERKSVHLLLNRNFPQARQLLNQFEQGLQKLAKNGQWAEVITPLELPKPARQPLKHSAIAAPRANPTSSQP